VHTILALRTLLTLAKLSGRRETDQALVLPGMHCVQGMLKISRVRGRKDGESLPCESGSDVSGRFPA
jgi:hypothetical protein